MPHSHLTFLYSIAAAIPYKTGNCKSKWAKPGTFTNIGAHLEFIRREMANERQPRMVNEREMRSNAMSHQFPVKLMITVISSMKIYNFL